MTNFILFYIPLQSCPPGSMDFRAVQCAQFNDKLINNRISKWEPLIVKGRFQREANFMYQIVLILKDEPCVLYCADEHNQFSKLGARVKDGTKCTMGRRDTCIAGVCRVTSCFELPSRYQIYVFYFQKIGCDFAIDSDAEEDNCGVCGGNGQSCSVVDATFEGIRKGIGIFILNFRGLRISHFKRWPSYFNFQEEHVMLEL